MYVNKTYNDSIADVSHTTNYINTNDDNLSQDTGDPELSTIAIIYILIGVLSIISMVLGVAYGWVYYFEMKNMGRGSRSGGQGDSEGGPKRSSQYKTKMLFSQASR